jgi:putative SOS response-associated peptidase YedK
MCGRYVLTSDPAVLVEEFDIDAPVERVLAQDFNVAPTKEVYVVVDKDDTRALEVARWGFLPRWAKDPAIGNRMINARVETMTEKPAYRDAAKSRRCIVPADGYYEWYRPRSGGPKQPFYIHQANGKPLPMAGLYSWWRATDSDPWLLTCTIITGEAPQALRSIHDRAPMCVPPEAQAAWLASETVDAPGLLTADLPVETIPVSTQVNNVRNNGPELLTPIGE